MRHAQWGGSGQTSIHGVRRGCPSSPVTCTRLTVWTTPPAFRILWLGQLCSVLPPASQKQSHVSHTPQPPESRWVRKDPVGEGYGGNRGYSRHWPGSLDEGARTVGSTGTSHLWRAIPSRILCESEDLGSCGWVLPIPYFCVEQRRRDWSRWHWGAGWDPCQYSESHMPCGSQVPWGPFLSWEGSKRPHPTDPSQSRWLMASPIGP